MRNNIAKPNIGYRDINKVEQTMADIEDQRLLADEVSRAIASPVTGDIIDEVGVPSSDSKRDLTVLCRTSSRMSLSSCNRRNSTHNLPALHMFRPMCPSALSLAGSVSTFPNV